MAMNFDIKPSICRSATKVKDGLSAGMRAKPIDYAADPFRFWN
jgi:hypothetical protein